MGNPIRYQDLISPDDSISNLVRQLDEANDAYSNLARSVQAEAQRMATSLQMVSGATAAGRSTIKGYSQDAEKLLKAERDLNFARSETARKIAELKAMQKDEQTITKLTIQLNRSSEGSYAALSAQYALNKIRLNNLTEEERKNTEQGQKLEAETRDIYDRMNELQKATGKYTLEVGNYEKAIGQLMGTQGRWYQNLMMLQALSAGGLTQGLKMAGQAVQSLGKQLLKLLANPIVAIIAAIAAVFMALSKAITSSEKNTRALERVMAPLKGIMDALLGVIQEAASWLLKGAEAIVNFTGSVMRLAEKLPFVGKAMKDINDKVEENIRLTKQRQRLADQERTWGEASARLMVRVAKLRADAESTKNAEHRLQLLQQAQKLEDMAYKSEMAYQRTVLDNMEKEAAKNQSDTETLNALSQQRIKVYNLEEQMQQRRISSNKKIAKQEKALDKENQENAKESAEKQKQIAENLILIQQKTQDIRISLIEDGFTREADVINNNYDRQIEQLKERAEKEKELREVINQQIIALESARHKELADLVTKYAEKDLAAKQKLKDDEKKMAEQTLRQQADVINAEDEIRQLEIDRLETSEKEKTRLRLEAEKERLQKLLALYQQNGKTLSDTEAKLIQEQIKNVDSEISKNQKSTGDIYDVLGFNLSDDKKEAINTSLSYAMDGLNQFMQAYTDAANKKRELADAEVERTQNVLQAELEARAKGYANDVETARKEVAEAKKNQQKAIEQQRRAQKAQIALDTAAQAANLITATSLIWKQLGFPWAIPALAVMWGSFAAAKIKAIQAAGEGGSEKYAEGTVELLDGGSHQSGNDIDLGRKKNGTRRRAEGGEFFAVINKRNSRRYRNVIPDVIHSLNDGTFANKYMNAYDKGSAVIMQPVVQQQDLSRLQDDVQRIREQGERTVFIDGQGRTVEIYKNVRRILKN